MSTKIRPYDPAVKELLQLADLVSQSDCPDNIRQGLRKVVDLVQKREDYAEECTSKSDGVARIREFTYTHNWQQACDTGKTTEMLKPRMLSGFLEGQFLKMLVSIQKPRRILELGMYTGSSAIAMAEALPPDGELVTCDREPYLREVAQGFFDQSPAGRKIQIHIGTIKDILRALLSQGRQFDLMFFDADDRSYLEYYTMALDDGLLAPGGTILVDNAFRRGKTYTVEALDMTHNPKGVFNNHVKHDPRVQQVLVPIRDGVMIIRRKEDVESDGKSISSGSPYANGTTSGEDEVKS